MLKKWLLPQEQKLFGMEKKNQVHWIVVIFIQNSQLEESLWDGDLIAGMHLNPLEAQMS